MKKILITFIITALVFTLLPVGAVIQEYVLYRADYKILINGSEYTDPELPVLNYKGNTYVPLRKFLDIAGAETKWDTELNQADITLAKDSFTPQKTVEDGVYIINGQKYVSMYHIVPLLTSNGYNSTYNSDSQTFVIYDSFNEAKILFTFKLGEELIQVKNRTYITFEVYAETIIPLTEK